MNEFDATDSTIVWGPISGENFKQFTFTEQNYGITKHIIFIYSYKFQENHPHKF